MNAVAKYLEHYAEPERHLAEAIEHCQGHCIVVPVCHESFADLQPLLDSVPQGPLGEVLVIMVQNARIDADAAEHQTHEATFAALRQHFGACETLSTPGLPAAHRFNTAFGSLLLVDRFTPPWRLPPKEGVGLARKIGTDIALQLWHRKKISSPWLHSTDADVALPNDYLNVPDITHAAALTYPFLHRGAPAMAPRMLTYELSLRYYVCGLAYAQSPFAFHTIGSTLAVRATSYAQVRGFPKRMAGEDFYLLNKLAKVGSIARPTTEPILIRARESSRVPFGTGPALRRMRHCPDVGLWPVYNPAVFTCLKVWLQFAAQVLAKPQKVSRAALEKSAEEATASLPLLWRMVVTLGAAAALQRAAKQSPQLQTRRRFWQGWFDGFRTLKLIHGLRDHGLPNQPLGQALTNARFAPRKALQTLEHMSHAWREHETAMLKTWAGKER